MPERANKNLPGEPIDPRIERIERYKDRFHRNMWDTGMSPSKLLARKLRLPQKVTDSLYEDIPPNAERETERTSTSLAALGDLMMEPPPPAEPPY